MQEDALRFDRLENEDCIRAYAQDFLAARRNLVLVVDDLDNTTSSLYSLRQYQVVPVGYGTPTPDPYYWICSNPSWYWKADYPVCSNALGSIEAHASNWTVYGYRIRYCQSESVDPKCRLNFNLPVLVIVIVFNAIKVVCICFVARRMRDQPMITLGDAVASFLRSPDAATKGMCLATRAHFQRSSKGLDWSQAIESPMTYKPQKMRWMRTASIRHWVATVFVFFAALATVLGLLGYAVPRLKTSYGQSGLGSLWSLGLGQARSQTMITGWSIPTGGQGALISAILVANSPQLILSLIYVVLNSLATRLLLAREWCGFARHRKPLRVSNPQGDQRCTYFLQIPYRYGIPLMLCSILLHWLISQSIYLAKVDTWSSTGIFTEPESITTCGFSPIGMMLTSIVAACLILAVFALGLRQLGSQIPFAGSCSAAISAACHAQGEISETAPLKWGAVPSIELGSVGHCAFSSGEVQEPVPGNAYA
ncbi:uncharacterized protein LTHEOB_7249 [Neofusicoccum parvum]|uniref:Uncharacterized protein LTHEOB_7249 n=1 Tax=Neofusicoccum parvum TaxID=310453 RepID=A0ACB5SMW9_9PEZI|nr:uncharacterized protein LTHEOB_7249 [Neofusicoccum parvum]